MRRSSMVSLALLLAACAAASNPRVGDATAVVPPPRPTKTAEPQTPAKPQASQAPATKPRASDAAVQPASAPISLGEVAGVPIDVDEFLSRLWLRDSRTAREVLEQIVFARLALNEADRLGIVLEPARVDAVVAKTLATLEKKLEGGGAKLTVDEHIRQNLELDPAFYKARLREDAIVQLLAERSVRAWVRENERCDVLVTEVREKDALPKVRAALDSGKPFTEVAREFGAGEDEATHTTAMTIVRSENQELSRAAFATGIGASFGPIEQSGRWLYLQVLTRHAPVSGTWAQIGPDVERDIAARTVEDLEYVQWRAAMVRRYRVDLEPFLELVEGKRP